MGVAKGIAAIALAAIVATVAGLAIAHGSSGAPNPHDRIATYADSLVRKVPLPQGSLPFSGSLPAKLKAPPLTNLAGDNAVNHHWVFRVDKPPDALMTAVLARGIPGFQVSVSDAPINGPSAPSIVLFEQMHPTPGVYSSQLTLYATRDGSNRSLMRIDAALTPEPSRTAAEHVSPTDTVVIIDRATTEPGGPFPPAATHQVITDRAAVARLIDLFNALPPTEPHTGTYVYQACPAREAIAVAFARTVNGTPDVAASSAVNCTVDPTPHWVFGVATDERAQLAIPPRAVPSADSPVARAERKRQQPSLTDPDGAFVRALEAELQK